MELKRDFKYISKRGILRGALGAFMGSVMFTIVNIVGYMANNKSLSSLNDILGLITILLWFIASFILSVLPALCGGRWLAHKLYQDSLQGLLTQKRAIIKGGLLGIVAGLCICVFVAIVIYHKGNYIIFIFRVISTLFIAGIIGGWTGLRLKDDITQSSR